MDLLSLVFFVLNALSRPRNARQRLTDILVKDGITFLVVRRPKLTRDYCLTHRAKIYTGVLQ